MLLMTKKIHADAMRKGAKTLEIRSGERYRNVKVGSVLSINGHFRLNVAAVERYEDVFDLLESLKDRFQMLNFSTLDEMLNAFCDCYEDPKGPFFVWSVSPISSTIKNPPFEQYSLAI